MKRRLRTPLASAAMLFAAAVPALAATISLDTYFAAPDGDYRELESTDTLTVGSNAQPRDLIVDTGDDTPFLFSVRNNDLDGWLAGSTGGRLEIDGELNIRNGAGTSLFYVDPVNNRVGIGTTAPMAPLDVRGQTNTIMIHGYSGNNTAPWNESLVEMLNEHFGTFDARNGFAGATGQPGVSLAFIYLYLEGAPLIFQSVDKGGGYFGPVAINCDIGSPYLATHRLIVGRPGFPKDAHATVWNILGCSRAFKTDVRPLAPGEDAAMLEALTKAPLYRYRYKPEPPDARTRLGFVAEEAPREVVDGDGELVSLGDSVGMLLASVQALKAEQDGLRRRAEELSR